MRHGTDSYLSCSVQTTKAPCGYLRILMRHSTVLCHPHRIKIVFDSAIQTLQPPECCVAFLSITPGAVRKGSGTEHGSAASLCIYSLATAWCFWHKAFADTVPSQLVELWNPASVTLQRSAAGIPRLSTRLVDSSALPDDRSSRTRCQAISWSYGTPSPLSRRRCCGCALQCAMRMPTP